MKPIKLDVPEPGHLSIAALMIYEQIHKNLARPERSRWVENLDFVIQVNAAKMFFFITKQNGTVRIQNGQASRPDATLTLARVRFWGNPLLLVLRRQIRLRGNMLKLMRFLLFITP